MIASRNYLSLGIEKDREYIVPAFFAAACQQFIIDGADNESIRSMGNGIAIGAAVITATFTGGTSFAAYLTYAGGIVSGADELIKTERLKLDQDITYKEKYESYFGAWDIFYSSVLLADGATGGYTLANNLRKVNLVRSTKNFYSKMKNFDLSGELMNVWNNLKGGSVAKGGNLNLGKFVKKIGDYEVYEGGEVFYRTMSKEHYDLLLSTKKLSATGETFTSPILKYSEGYEGYLVKIQTKPGTIEKLQSIGVSDGTDLVKSQFMEMPKSTSGWGDSKVLFKKETKAGITPNQGQVNIGLGKGTGLDTFNENIIGIELIKIIKK